MKNIISRMENKITSYLSHRPTLYALVVGFGIVLVWRGIWHTIDQIHVYLNYVATNPMTIDASLSPWWDGPLSLVAGVIVLHFTGAFISSFIGNELILSGLRGEKRLNEKTEVQVENEVRAISDIKEALHRMSNTIEELEKKVLEHHTKAH